MDTEGTSSLPPLSDEDEKEAQKQPDRLRENGVINGNRKRTGFEDKTLWDKLNSLLKNPRWMSLTFYKSFTHA